MELDDEFAFSTHATREAWAAQQREYKEFAAEMDRKRAEREAAGETESDEFASAWTGMVSDEPIPGDAGGNLKLAFLLAEAVSELETLESPKENIRRLNADFTAFRTANADERQAAATRLGETLESLGEQHPRLIPRVADFRSRIDEQLREPAIDDLEFPY